jgi:hypothetical protein
MAQVKPQYSLIPPSRVDEVFVDFSGFSEIANQRPQRDGWSVNAMAGVGGRLVAMAVSACGTA